MRLAEMRTGRHKNAGWLLGQCGFATASRSVLRVVLAHAGDEASTQLIARILADAFSTPPLAFDPAWFAYTGPPDVLATDQWDEAHNYGAALDMLRYQIADLRRMADAGTLGGPNRWFGITSPTRYTWYNIEPQAFLECQTGGMVVDENVHESDWGELVIILWLGEIYE